jgi:hypothetical protein
LALCNSADVDENDLRHPGGPRRCYSVRLEENLEKATIHSKEKVLDKQVIAAIQTRGTPLGVR